jgi:predicted Rossmann fold flavoprotein
VVDLKSNNIKNMRVAIIGGGAAGMMAAATINEYSPETEVFLIEKNDSLGKKVIISGGGRCNVTTGISDIKTVLKKYPRGEKFLISAMHRFSPEDVYKWFESHGVPLKCEDDLRVFPKSDDGHDVVKVFEKIFKNGNTQILFNHNVESIRKDKENFEIHFKGWPLLTVDRVVLCVGGQAYRQTGSVGDGYAFAESLGHKITSLAASLNSFITKEKWVRDISGVSFEKCKIYSDRKKEYSFTGSFLFTHTGISGPAVFALSSLVAFEEYGPKNPLPIFIDFLPDISDDELYKKINNLKIEHAKKTLKNTVHLFVPESVVEIILQEQNVSFEKKTADATKEDMQKIISWLKKMPLNAIGRGAGDEFVTAGGVDLSEVDPKTMESKICKGLFFAGEILDIDGFTGGFNLQASWATGFAAGRNVII